MHSETAAGDGIDPAARGCRICAGALELRHRGGLRRVAPDALAPAEHRRGQHGGFWRCHECGTVQQPSLPRGEALHGLYRQMRDDAYLAEESGRRASVRRLLDVLAPHAATGRLLDVGAGHGLMLDEARRRGFDVIGLELSATAAAHAREILGLTVHEQTLEAAELEPGSFDAIVLTDVFEHVSDPLAVLARCHELLAPGGALMLSTPDPSSRTARLAGARWWSLLAAHHCLVPRRTVRELIAACGLVAVDERRFVRVFSLSYWLAGLAGRGGAARAAGALATVVPPGIVLSAALGDDRTYVARRVEVRKPQRPLVTPRGGEHFVAAVIPAHQAQATIARVADELPVAAIDRALVVDDASSDETVAVALEAGLEVLVHPVNRGYGANQKTCYVRAALDGADIVVMVHGDNQYDPSLIPEMTREIELGVADVVIGSRMLQDRAIAGGMPRWKWVGNRALTWVENRGFRRHFSEYHTGYRAFSMEILDQIAFLRNADGFVFDQEIIAQLIASGARIVELAIPTRYFLEASSVSFRESVRYGLRTLALLARYRADARRPWALLRRPAAPPAHRRAGQRGLRLDRSTLPRAGSGPAR